MENLMNDFPRIDKEDRYHLARNFHTFIGMANVISAEKKSSDIEHTWMCEGSWYDLRSGTPRQAFRSDDRTCMLTLVATPVELCRLFGDGNYKGSILRCYG